MMANSYETYRCSGFLHVLDHYIMYTLVNFIGHFARNRQLRTVVKSPVDLRHLMTDLRRLS